MIEETQLKALREDENETEKLDLSNGVGTVAAGGRYDNLVNMFDNKYHVPCIGFSIGVERLFTVIELKMKKNNIKIRANKTQVYVIAAQASLLDEKLDLVNTLWSNNINVLFLNFVSF